MASKSSQSQASSAGDIGELLDVLEQSIDRLKVMYEQYFMGIQKSAPTFLHNDAERKIRELSQNMIRNTGLRYRFNSLQAKFNSYNNYWRRTLRQIEQGKYTKNLAKIGRRAAQAGAEIPEEILAAMPKRMRDQVVRDRELAVAIAGRRGQLPATQEDAGQFDEELSADDLLEDDDDDVGVIRSLPPVSDMPEPVPAPKKVSTPMRGGAHILDESAFDDFNVDEMFAAISDDKPEPVVAKPAPARTRRPTSVPPPLPRDPTPAVFPSVTRPAPNPGAAAAGTGSLPSVRAPAPVAAVPRVATPSPAAALPRVITPVPADTVPSAPAFPMRTATPASTEVPIQRTTPIAGIPRVAATTPVAGVPRVTPTAQVQRTTPAAGTPRLTPVPASPPPGMSDADVKNLYAKYVKAREMVGEKSDEATYARLMKTIQQQAPKIMEQYKSKGVEFGVVVKDNQVILKAKPKS